MNPAWINTGGNDDDRQYVIIMQDGSAALGTMDTITERVFCLLHHKEETYGTKAVWRIRNGRMVEGKVTFRVRGSEVSVWLSDTKTRQQWGYAAFTL